MTEVQAKTKEMAGSKIGVAFDTLKQGDKTTPISAAIVSITKATAAVSATNDSLSSDAYGSSSARTSTQSSGQQSNGGLLGGATNTVGSVASTATSAVGGVANTAGSVTNSVGQTVGSTAGSVVSNIPGLQVSQSADASAGGSSTISLNSGNLKLDQGTVFNLRLSESATVSSQKPTK